MKRSVKFGEMWALDPREIRADDDSIFILFSPEAPENEYVDGVACVHVRGPLDHHAGFGDNYDAIRRRAKEAFACEDVHTVVFKLDSPGGAVSGLIDTVRAIRGMSEASDKRSIAYVDERAFSAAYALACSCDEIVLPESGLTGSIGVISTMADQVERDREQGFNFVTITSGARKADGHIHVPITEEAVRVEQERVDELARQFFALVSEARGLSMRRIQSFQAGLFLGRQAVDDGVADRVSTFDQLLDELSSSVTHFGTSRVKPSREAAMKGYRTALLAELKEARKALASAKAGDKPKLEGKVAGYEAALEAYKKVTEKHVEHSKTHEEDEDDDEDGEGNETDRGDDEDGDEKKDEEAAAASKSAKASAGGKRKSRMSDEEEEAAAEDDEEEAAYEDEEEEASGRTGVAALVASLERPGMSAKARAALHALKANAEQGAEALRIAKRLEAKREADTFRASVDSALGSKRLTPHEAKCLRAGKDVTGKPLASKDRNSYLRALLHGRPKAVAFAQGDDGVPLPGAAPEWIRTGKLPDDMQKQLEEAKAAIPGLDTKAVIADYAAKNGLARGDV